jgi:hypothetical protein
VLGNPRKPLLSLLGVIGTRPAIVRKVVDLANWKDKIPHPEERASEEAGLTAVMS